MFFDICTPIGIIPGIICIAIGLILRNHQKRFEQIAELVRAYRRIKISELARKMGKTEFDTERILVQCIDRKLIEGYFDRNTGEFFTKEEMWQRLTIQNCPRCGAPHDQIHLVIG